MGGTAGVKKGSKLLSKNLEKANQLLEVKAALEQLSIDGTLSEASSFVNLVLH